MASHWERIVELENTNHNNNVFSSIHNYFNVNTMKIIPNYRGTLPNLKILNSKWKEQEEFPVVYLMDDFLETEAIIACLKLERETPQDLYKWPLTNIITDISLNQHDISQNLILTDMMEIIYGNISPKWRREKYNSFVRLSPFRVADYVTSPIYNVVSMLEKIARSFATWRGITEELRITLCVLQQVLKGTCMDVHRDSTPGGPYKRRVSFIYYLTDPSEKDSGGELCLHEEKDEEPVVKIESKSNRLVLIDLTEDGGPWHSVANYTGDTPRLSIVGFLSGL